MPRHPDDVIRTLLAPGETLLWSGRPRQGVVFSGFDVFAIPFSIVWAGVAFLGFGAALVSDDTPLMATAFVVPFVLVGLYITVGRFWIDARLRGNTHYGVTTERVLIRTGLFRPSTKSLDLGTLSDLAVTERRDGRGTITFGSSPIPVFFQSALRAQGFGDLSPSFDTIPDAGAVFRTIREAQRALRP